MQFNLTTVLLLGVLGLVGWKLLADKDTPILPGQGSPAAQPIGGTPPAATGAAPDVFSQITSTATALFNAASNIAQAVQKSN